MNGREWAKVIVQALAATLVVVALVSLVFWSLTRVPSGQ